MIIERCDEYTITLSSYEAGILAGVLDFIAWDSIEDEGAATLVEELSFDLPAIPWKEALGAKALVNNYS